MSDTDSTTAVIDPMIQSGDTQGQIPTPGQIPNPAVEPPTEKGKSEPETFSREYVETLRRENKAYRLAEEKNQREKMTEVERAAKERDEYRQRAEAAETRLQREMVANQVRSVAMGLNFHSADDAVDALGDLSVFYKDGEVDTKTVRSLVEKLVQDKPYLVRSATPGSGDGGGTTPPKPLTDADRVAAEEERLAQAGRVRSPI